MKVLRGTSREENGTAAVGEATADWDATPDVIIAFTSTARDPKKVAKALAHRWPDVPTIGCTTAGEHLDGAHENGSLVLIGIVDPLTRWACAVADDVRSFGPAEAEASASAMFEALGVDRDALDPAKLFCLCLLDGSSATEEGIASEMADALDGVTMLGGSAGDDLAFATTWVFANGACYEHGAIFLMGKTERSFRVLKHQHMAADSSRPVVVTRADPATRRVFELDGYPAATRYAEVLGVPRSELTSDRCFLRPTTVELDGESYIRSIRAIEDDDSLSFYCAIEEGMVLDIASPEKDQSVALSDALEPLEPAELVIGFNCILRSLEASKAEQHEALGAALGRFSKHSIAFDTYGEQVNGLHMNQTLVAIAFDAAPEEVAA